jgi:hypothetical protein
VAKLGQSTHNLIFFQGTEDNLIQKGINHPSIFHNLPEKAVLIQKK